MGKRKKDFLPKRVGRLKIPKRIRRGVLGAAIASGAGQAVIAALILKAGGHLAERASAVPDESLEAWLDGGADQFADHAPAEAEPAAPGRRDGIGPAATAPRGAKLNVKHALGQAALAFILGLSHPSAKRRSPVAPRRDRANGSAGEDVGADPRADGGARLFRPASPEL